MLDIVFFVTILLTTVTCKYAGDECAWQGAAGTCAALAQCPALEGEVRASGNPLPHRVVLRLQSAICGYDASGPLVCCVKSSTTVSPDKNYSSDNKDNHGQSEGSDPEDKEDILYSAEDKTASTQTISEPPDITGHPNLSKLPTNCGNMHVHKLSGAIRPALYEMPWMVILNYNSTSDRKNDMCGGTLINEWYVLTAAHCVSDNLKLDHVTLGEWDFRTDPDCDMVEDEKMVKTCAPPKRDVGVATVISYPGYKPGKFVDDIALIRLTEPADFTLDTMAPICLPVTRDLQREELVNKTGIVAGWGLTAQGYMSPILRSIGLRIVSNRDCQGAYRRLARIHNSHLCAGGYSEKDSCKGDSGGPIFLPGVVRGAGVKQVQRGVISFGTRVCSIIGFPGVYTNVAYYMDWILNSIT